MSRYVLGSEKDFYDFIDSLSKKDKIGLVTHTDLDGIASGIFLQKILEFKGLKVSSINFLNYNTNSLKDIIKSKFDVLVFTDWKLDDYPEYMDKIREKSRLLIFDHHPLNNTLFDKKGIIKTNYDYCSSHALFDIASKGEFFDTKNWEWLVSSAIVSDYTWDKDPSNFEFIKSIYPGLVKDNSIWDSEPGKIGKKINGALIYYFPNIKKVYELILKGDLSKLDKADRIIQKEVNKLVIYFKETAEYFPEKRFYFGFGNSKYNVISTIASILSDEFFRDNSVFLVSNFVERKDFVKVSARDQTGKVDLGNLLKYCVKDIKEGDGGGHPRAASATFRKMDLYKFKKNLIKNINNYRIA